MKWGDDTAFNLDDGTISEECQANFDATIEQAYEYGINHFETARGYGCSEKQFCQSLRCGTIRAPPWRFRAGASPLLQTAPVLVPDLAQPPALW